MGNQIKLDAQTMLNVREKRRIIFADSQELVFVEISTVEEEEVGRFYDNIYRRSSDGQHFRISIFLCRYGHKDYGFELELQDPYAHPVRLETVTINKWVSDEGGQS